MNDLAGNKTKMRFGAKAIKENFDDLPENFNKWLDEGYVSEPKNQGGCGSCYAMATVGMIEARLRIK